MKWRDMEEALDFGEVLTWIRTTRKITKQFGQWLTSAEDFLLALIRAADGPRYQVFVHRQLERFKDDQEHDTVRSPLFEWRISRVERGRRYAAVLIRIRCIQAHSQRSFAVDARPTAPPIGYVVQASDGPFAFHHTTWKCMKLITDGHRGGIIAGGDSPGKR